MLPGQRGDLEILIVQALDCVQYKDADVRSIDRAAGAQRGIKFNSVIDLRLAPEPGGVDEDYLAAVKRHWSVDRIAGGAGAIGDHQPLFPEQPVDERGLSDVGAADDGDTQRIRNFFGHGRNSLDQNVEHVPGVFAIERRNGHRITRTELLELVEIGRARVIHFVGDQHPRLARFSKQVDDARIAGMETGFGIHYEHQEIRLFNGLQHLTLDLDVHRNAGVVGPAAGVDEPELAAVPLCAREVPVPCGSCFLADNRAVLTDDAVEERRLADVWTPDQGDHRQIHAATPIAAEARTSMKSYDGKIGIGND